MASPDQRRSWGGHRRVAALVVLRYPVCAMALLAPTPAERLLDAAGRPYFLWDDDMTLDVFRQKLDDPDGEVRAYFIGKLMRQAKPDDVFSYVTLRRIQDQWPQIERYLGTTREFWRWLLDRWGPAPDAAR